MKATLQLALTTVPSLLLASSVNADKPAAEFLGVEIHDFTDFFLNDHPSQFVRSAYANAGLSTYRVYAAFSAPAMVLAHGGKMNEGINVWSNSTDGVFWNFEESNYYGDFNYDIAPLAGEINANPSHAFDTFGTIGAFVNPGPVKMYNYEQFVLQTGHMATNWVATDSGWYGSPTHSQMIASQTQQGLETNGLYRIGVMQISVAHGAMIEGNLGILGGHDSDGSQFEIWDGQVGGLLYYNSALIPAPGTLALLGLAGFVSTRRRRAS